MRILVTGGAGYIGSSVVHQLLSNGHEVRVADLLIEGGQSLATACRYPGFEIIARDIRDDRVASDAVAGCEAIVHLAAIVGTPACDLNPDAAISTNVGATETLLAACSPAQKFIFASTGSVYGAVPSGYCDENTPPTPATLYAWTKYAAEQKVREAENGIVMRLATVFGVSRALRWDLLVNRLTFQAVTHRTVEIYQPQARRSFIHVDDVSRALCSPILDWSSASEKVFNVGDEDLNITKVVLARTICDETGADLTLGASGEDPDMRDYTMSFSKLAELGFRCNQSLSSGVRELAKAAELAARRW